MLAATNTGSVENEEVDLSFQRFCAECRVVRDNLDVVKPNSNDAIGHSPRRQRQGVNWVIVDSAEDKHDVGQDSWCICGRTYRSCNFFRAALSFMVIAVTHSGFIASRPQVHRHDVWNIPSQIIALIVPVGRGNTNLRSHLPADCLLLLNTCSTSLVV